MTPEYAISTSAYVQEMLYFVLILNIMFLLMFVPSYVVWRLARNQNSKVRRICTILTVPIVSLLIAYVVAIWPNQRAVNYSMVN